jgi:hypothetical protein
MEIFLYDTLKFKERGQLFIRPSNETLSVACDEAGNVIETHQHCRLRLVGHFFSQ